MVELQPSKLTMRVRFPLPAQSFGIINDSKLNFNIRTFPPEKQFDIHVYISSLFTIIHVFIFDAHIAQSVEHFLGKEEVTGSNPVMGFFR